MWRANDPRWLYIFVPFLALVVGLMAVIALSDVEVDREQVWTNDKKLYVCDSPDWVFGNVDEALERLGDRVSYSDVIKTEGPCETLNDVKLDCHYTGKSGDRTSPCVDGSVVLTKAGPKYNYGDHIKGGHGDEALWWSDDEESAVPPLARVTVEFPLELSQIKAYEDIDSSKPIIDENYTDLELRKTWPIEAELLVVMHALLHAEGLSHAHVTLIGPFISAPRGHVMSPNIADLGFSLEGVPKAGER